VSESVEDNVPPAFVGPHEGREFELMLEGKKHLSMFLLEDAVEYGDYPDKRFDALAAEGRLVKHVCVEHSVLLDGIEMSLQVTMYASVSEAWRIPAMRMVRDIYAATGPGWRPDLERMIGSLLGYDRQDVELFVERLAQQHG
jgi:hypothetical protein